jgi:hypothetical protein
MLGVDVRGRLMRKTIVSSSPVQQSSIHDSWLDLEQIAQVEITSEDRQFPIENALARNATTGWRAATTGPQLIRLRFDQPQTIRRIQLHFVDKESERSQEIAIVAGSGSELKEIARQQWSFSPHGSTEEIEDYTVNLGGISTLELRIDPDRILDPKQSHSYASLQSLLLA